MRLVKPTDTLEDISAQVAVLEEAAYDGDFSVLRSPAAMDTLESLEGRRAFAASELMTGMRWHREREEYLEVSEAYQKALGAIAVGAMLEKFDETGDSKQAEWSGNSELRSSYIRMVGQDYRMRLSRRPWERAKQRVAQHDLARTTVPAVMAGSGGLVGALATTIVLKGSETPSFSSVDISPTVGGLMGSVAVMAAMSARPAVRGITKQAGSFAGNQLGLSLLPYVLDKFDKEDSEEAARDLESLIGGYAMRDLEMTLLKVKEALFDHKIESRNDIQPLVEKVLQEAEVTVHRHYGVDPDTEWPGPWYVRLPSKVLRINLAT